MLGHVSAKSVGVRSTSNHCDESKGSKLLMMYVISRSGRILLDASKWQIRSSKSSRHMQVDVWACALLCGGSKENAELRGLLCLTRLFQCLEVGCKISLRTYMLRRESETDDQLLTRTTVGVTINQRRNSALASSCSE